MRQILQNRHEGIPPWQSPHQGKSYRIALEDLMVDGQLDSSMARWCQHRRDDGAVLFLRSSQGEQHARQAARSMGIESLFCWH